MSEHTAGSLVTDGTTLIRSAESGIVIAAAEFADVDVETARANAEFIVCSWNAHDDLLAACEATLACLGPNFETYRQLKAAIAKAKEKP